MLEAEEVDRIGYRKLAVYEKSYDAALEVYRMSEGFPERERYAMEDQIRRAAVSIPMNIAEGYGKQESAAEFKRYLRMAMGSSNEVSVLLDFAKDLGYLEEEKHSQMHAKYEEIGKMLHGLMKAVK